MPRSPAISALAFSRRERSRRLAGERLDELLVLALERRELFELRAREGDAAFDQRA
jgi:hypothetical protein